MTTIEDCRQPSHGISPLHKSQKEGVAVKCDAEMLQANPDLRSEAGQAFAVGNDTKRLLSRREISRSL